MKEKINKKVLIIAVFTLVLIMGISYAFFTEVIIGEKNYSVTTGKLQIILDESNTSKNIAFSDAIPVTDDDGRENEKYKFSLVNNTEEDLEYTIYLVEEEQAKKTPSSAIRYYYSRDVGDIEVIRGMTDNKDDEGKFYLEDGVISKKTTYNYEFCLWLGYDSDNSVMGTSYSVHLEVVAVQDLSLYKELALNGTDPVLSPKLVAVIIEDDGTVIKADTREEWYNYTNREWANAVVLIDTSVKYKVGDVIPESNIESYFVWIPRYKYKIFDEGNYTSLTSLDSQAVQTIEIEFENKDTTPVSGTKVGDWHSHPAFQAFDSNGFWVGKFESSGENSDIYNPDVLRIKPNQASWRNITVGNAFRNSYEYMRSEESHMMKNTEWGAVAYLQHSIYGSRQSVRVNNNSAYLTGYASISEPTCGYNNGTSTSCNLVGTATSVTLPYNTTTGYLASTTANITGIYDMAGGAWEYVMGYTTAANSVGGSSGLVNIYEDFFTKTTWEKYYDKYTENSITGFNNRILGDATGEMGGFASVADPDGYSRQRSSWYGDYANFVNATSSWFGRGGGWDYGVGSGVFAILNYTGGVYVRYSFRIVLTPNN